MRTQQAIGLIIRRGLAFAIDLGMLLFFLELACIAAIFGGLEFFDPGWNPVFVAGCLCYFGGFEALCKGQTPGKRLTGIRLRTTTGQSMTAYQTFARVSLMLILPITIMLLYKLLLVLVLRNDSTRLAEPFLSVSSHMIWPISAIIGGGRIGMHDLLMGTVVTRERDADGSRVASVSWLNPCAVLLATCLISGIYVKLVIGLPLKQLDNLYGRMSGEERLAWVQFARTAEDLWLRVENGPEFIAGGGALCFRAWSDAIWEQWSVKRSCVALPDNIREGKLKFRLDARYLINVTPRGLVSGPFQQAVAREICRRVAQRDVLMTFEFVNTSQMWMFTVTARKRCLGFYYDDIGKDGKKSTFLAILEPDKSFLLMPGIAFGDITSDSPNPLPAWWLLDPGAE